jgi:hypothetical protein
MKWRGIPFLLLLTLLAAGVCSAQFALRGSISGIITDSSQAIMPGVAVTLTDVGRNQVFKAVSNATGLYSFTQLNIGRYQISVEHPGFRKAVSAVIDLATGQIARLDLVLEVGAVTESVEITASAPLLQTGQALVGQTVERDLITSLPVKGRNFTAFAALAPNIYSFPSSGSGGGVSYLTGGGGDNGMYINGVYSNTTWGGTTGTVYSPSVEALSEVKIETAGFSAANGRDLSTYQAIIRGGTNQYHGTVLENFENSVLRAWNPYTKLTLQPGAKKRVVQRNEFGGNFGGPVWLPKLYSGRDKAFFFVNYERLYENTGAADAIFRVPTAAERQGDFSELLRRFPGDANRVLWNPFSTTIDANGNSNRLPVPNNDLRAIGIQREAQEILGMYPMPNGYSNPANASDLRNYSTFSAGGARRYKIDTRFDYRITNNDNVYVNHSRHNLRGRNLGGLIPELTGNNENWANLVTANYAKVITPTLTNEFIFGWAYYESHPASLGVVDYLRRTDTLRNKFFKNIGTGIDKGFHRIALSGGGWSSIGFNEIFINTQLKTQFANNMSYIRGAHSLKFGFNYLYENEHDWDYLRDVQFSSTMTRGGSLNGRRGGDGLATFLLGVPSYILQPYKFPAAEEPRLDFSSVYWGFYVDDKWQVTPRLTLSLGLRNDLAIPMYSPMSYGNVKMDFGYPGWQELIPGRFAGLSQHFVPAPKRNFAPRLSLAYQIQRDFLARVSYGMFYMAGSTVNGGSTVDYLNGGVPGYIGAEYFNAAAGVHDDLPYWKWGDIFPTQQDSTLGTFPVSTAPGAGYFDYPKAVVAYDEKSGKLPYYQRYMVELQKGFGPATILSLSYLGGRGTRLIYYENVNKPAYRTGWPSANVYNNARPSPRFEDIRLVRAGRNSFYNSMTAKLERRLTRGLQVTAHYSFSKTVQDYGVPQAGWFGITNSDFGGYAEIVTSWDWNGRIARGEAPFSHPHRFVAAFSYETPWGRAFPTVAKALLWGWTLSGITTFESGNALTVWNGVTTARDYEPDVASVLSGNPNLPRGDRSFRRYFNTAAFYAPPNDVKGNAGLGIVRAPGVNNWDLAIAKTFRPREKLRVDFRADMLNALNHIQWSGVNSTFSDAQGNTFGWITGARDGRFVQFLLRMSF